MVDDTDIQGLDPYDLMQAEANRLDRFFTGLDDAVWSRPSRCEGWSVHDVLAHLLASEQYNSASLAGTVGDYLASVGGAVRPISLRPTSSESASSTITPPRS